MASQILSQPEMTFVHSTFTFAIKYSILKHLSAGKCICSPVFPASGYDWTLRFHPRGRLPEAQGSHASIYLGPQNAVSQIDVEVTFHVLGKEGNFISVASPHVCTYTKHTRFIGLDRFIACDTIEQLYCVDGVLSVACTIRVLPQPKTVRAYPGGLCEHIERFWEKKEKFDVTFEVQGETISAHRFMLAARSPVFEANLFGPMAEAKMECIKIDEMKAEVFKALLNFVYTDQLVEDKSGDQETLSVQLLQDLIMAADRYALDKLILLCEEQLETSLSVETVVTTLLVADRHSRARLKKKCLEFASSPENFSQVALTEEFMTLMLESPSLLAELREEVKRHSHCTKKPRTG